MPVRRRPHGCRALRAAATATSLALALRGASRSSASGAFVAAADASAAQGAAAALSARVEFGETLGAASRLVAGAAARRVEGRRARRTARSAWETFEEFCQDPVVSCVGWSMVLASLPIIKVAVSGHRTDTPTAYLQSEPRGRIAPVVCLGDSLTCGNLSSDWVSHLRDELTNNLSEPTVVLNAGVNMETARNALQRLDEVIACKPSHVTILVGTNDLKAQHSPMEGFLYKVLGKLPKVATIEDYEKDLQTMRDRLLAVGARVALVSPPVLGEDVDSRANRAAAAYAETVRRVAAEGGEHCVYLPLFERTAADLPKVGGRPYCGMRFFFWLCLLCFDIHLWNRDLGEVQKERNLGVTVDLVHLGPAAARSLSDMVAAFVAATPVPPLSPFGALVSQVSPVV